ncbi:MAG TPA: SGNH/GDSL hydrolase family protein [Chitinophagaceae bacterium]
MPFSKVKKRIGFALFLVLFTIIAAEIILRIYNPFATSVTGDRITLHTNTIVVINNGPNASGLDESVTVKKNSLGFRGPEPPQNFNDHLTILTVGGSTTECLFIPEEKTWPHLLGQQLQSSFNNVWLNNAGLNGHSTYGHLQLMKEYIVKLHPDYCLFLVGCNEVNRTDLTPSDSNINNEQQKLIVKLANYSVLANVSLNFYRHHLASQRELVNNKHFSLRGKEKRAISDSIIQLRVQQQAILVNQYEQRLRQLISLCSTSNITPVFITQPCLLGDITDDITGINMGSYPLEDNSNGKLNWTLLQLYNQKTLAVCKANGIYTIDLASLLPMSSRYFYDNYHHTNEGCKKISEIIYDILSPMLAKKELKHLVK